MLCLEFTLVAVIVQLYGRLYISDVLLQISRFILLSDVPTDTLLRCNA